MPRLNPSDILTLYPSISTENPKNKTHCERKEKEKRKIRCIEQNPSNTLETCPRSFNFDIEARCVHQGILADMRCADCWAAVKSRREDCTGHRWGEGYVPLDGNDIVPRCRFHHRRRREVPSIQEYLKATEPSFRPYEESVDSSWGRDR
jgi:hypothetical protein